MDEMSEAVEFLREMGWAVLAIMDAPPPGLGPEGVVELRFFGGAVIDGSRMLSEIIDIPGNDDECEAIGQWVMAAQVAMWAVLGRGGQGDDDE